MEVFQTTDYDKFTILIHSRSLVKGYVLEKVAWVNQPKDGRHARLALVEIELNRKPIQVNKNMEILEGKHRFEILRRLELPVSYIIVERVT